jgi:hypothetical protein
MMQESESKKNLFLVSWMCTIHVSCAIWKNVMHVWIILFSAVLIKILSSGLIKLSRCHFLLKSYIIIKHFVFYHMLNWIIIKEFWRMRLYQHSYFDILLKLCNNLNFVCYWSWNKTVFLRERSEWDKNVWIWGLFWEEGIFNKKTVCLDM